ncbi:MAG: SDR family oxidoreductase [Planctomycetota bacterium]
MCVITGAGSGIGAATAHAFASAGAKAVYVTDQDKAAADGTVNFLRKQGFATVSAVVLDVTSEPDAERLAATVKREHGRLDVLVNNAGIGFVGSIEETSAEDMDRLYAVNVAGVFLVATACTSLLLPSITHRRRIRGAATVLNIASIAGLVGLKRRFAYCMTKGAVVAMTRQLATEYVSRGLRVNAVCPGTVDTPFVDAYLRRFHAGEEEKTRAELNARQPIGRMGRPEEVASLLVYLASDAATFATGAIWPLDGGLTMV